eukprot:COSAG02_NODE_32906_length_508_cov_1.520782_1_plen_64_part_01
MRDAHQLNPATPSATRVCIIRGDETLDVGTDRTCKCATKDIVTMHARNGRQKRPFLAYHSRTHA